VLALRAAAPAPEVAVQPPMTAGPPVAPPPVVPHRTGRSGPRVLGFPPFFALVVLALVAAGGWGLWQQREPSEEAALVAELEAMADRPMQDWSSAGSPVEGDLARFCASVERSDARLVELKQRLDRLDGPAMSSYATAERAGWLADLDVIDAEAPAEIREPARVVSSSVREIVDGVAAADSFEEAADAIMGVLSSEYVQAGGAWTDFIGRNCIGP
jgi:hypothetical protein